MPKCQPDSLIEPTALEADLIASDEMSPASERNKDCKTIIKNSFYSVLTENQQNIPPKCDTRFGNRIRALTVKGDHSFQCIIPALTQICFKFPMFNS